MIWPAVSLHAKFFLSLTLPTANPTTSLAALQRYLNNLDPLDPAMKPELLTAQFFTKLDDLFKRLLFDSFQTFMNSTPQETYFQNKVPVLDSDAENSESEEQDKTLGTVLVPSTSAPNTQVIEISWQERYRSSYIKSVLEYIAFYAKFNIELYEEGDEVRAFQLMLPKVAYFLKASSEETSIMPTGSFWMAPSTPLPLVTPSFLNAFLGSLNAIEDAVLAVCHPFFLFKFHQTYSYHLSDFRIFGANDRVFCQIQERRKVQVSGGRSLCLGTYHCEG